MLPVVREYRRDEYHAVDVQFVCSMSPTKNPYVPEAGVIDNLKETGRNRSHFVKEPSQRDSS